MGKPLGKSDLCRAGQIESKKSALFSRTGVDKSAARASQTIGKRDYDYLAQSQASYGTDHNDVERKI